MKTVPGWKVVLLLAIAAGIFFRFFNISHKVYWHDETINAARVAGYAIEQVSADVPKDTVLSIEVLQKYQYPSSENSAVDTIRTLAQWEPQNPPLYYLLSRQWLKANEHSIAASRRLSAVIGVICLAISYGLGQELLGSALAGWLMTAIVAISPFHVLYAQEARPFSLWTLTILLSSLCLLRALRKQTCLDWGAYTVAAIAGLYTFPFTLFVIVSHGLYVVVSRWATTNLVRFGVTSSFSLLCFSPWLVAIAQNSGKMNPWRSTDTSIASLVKTWVGNVCRLFFDVNLDATSPLVYVLIPALLILSLVAYGAYHLLRRAPEHVTAFIIFLTLVTAFALILPDLISGGRRSSVSRYFVPTYLGLQLLVTHLIAQKITARTATTRRLWSAALAVIIGAGIVSNLVSANARVWWTKPLSPDNFAIVQAINAAPNPVLITDKISWQTLELSHYLSSDAQLLMPVNISLEQLETPDSSEFLLYPTKQLLDYYAISPDYQINKLEQLNNHNIYSLER